MLILKEKKYIKVSKLIDLFYACTKSSFDTRFHYSSFCRPAIFAIKHEKKTVYSSDFLTIFRITESCTCIGLWLKKLDSVIYSYFLYIWYKYIFEVNHLTF